MIALACSVLLASLVGSAHCAGMCGGLAAFCGGVGQCTARRSAGATATYHAARGVSYMAVGALAGGLGTLLNAGGTLVGVQRVAALAAGVAVALVGGAMLLKAAGVEGERVHLPGWVRRALGAVHQAAAAMPLMRRAVVVGLATPLLPCGWLWAFAAVAAGTGSVVWGAVVMAAFWLGTVPALAVIGAGVAGMGGERRRWLHAAAGVVMIAVGVYTAGVRSPAAELVAQRLEARQMEARQMEVRQPETREEVEPVAVVDVGSIRPACCAQEHEP